MTSRIFWVIFTAVSLAAGAGPSAAQTIGYAEAFDRLAASCRQDIDRLCKSVSLGGGRIQQCLNTNAASVSSGCKTTLSDVTALLQKRAAARTAVMRVCDRDIRRLCTGIQPGDGNLMECFYKARRNASQQCQQIVMDAGYDVALAPAQSSAPINLTSADLVNSLQGVEASAQTFNAAQLRQLVAQGLRDPSRSNRVNREPLSDQLGKQAQFTIAVEFDLNSSRIRPDSFRAVGLMADALYHPYLQGYRFLVIGHTDARGNREHNLKLSQQRADAIRQALINPFGIAASRLEAIGFGEEQLLNRQHPEAAENRRVQLINVGK